MEGAFTPAALFNAATISLHIPTRPLSPNAAPPATTLSAPLSPEQANATDEWVTQLSTASEREEAYYDEALPFYLLLRLTPLDLTRTQAQSFLLPSLLPDPHLHLTAELSYVEGTADSTASAVPQLSAPPRRGLKVNGIGLGQPGSAPRGRANDLDGQIPETPSPFPSTRPSDAGFVDSTGVTVWSYAFHREVHNPSLKVGERTREGDALGHSEGRVWVGRDGGDSGTGGWIGIWEFSGNVAFVRSRLVNPRICLTLTLTFRDDPRLEDLLERTSSRRSLDGTPADIVAEEDEYMIESFDDVNLLEGLDNSSALHLPASRLPLPSLGASGSLDQSRRPSAGSHRRSLSLSGGGVDTPSHPAIRRAYRRVLDVRSALNTRMRTVACPSEHVGNTGLGDTNGDSLGLGEMQGEGMALCVEVEGGGSEGGAYGFLVESLEVEVSGGSGASDVEIKSIDEGVTFPVVLGAMDQYNFLYSVNFTGQPIDASPFSPPPIVPPFPVAISIFAATSPSQRFSAKFGDVRASDLLESTPAVPIKEDSIWMRNVAIIVTGRPVKLSSGGSVEQGGARSLTNRSKSSAVVVHTPESLADSSPTASFASRWNCTLDISPFALRAQSRTASFYPSPSETAGPLPATAISRFSVASAPSYRQPSKRPVFEAIAGSKRHTISGLASLTAKTAETTLRNAQAATYRSASASRGLPSVPDLPTPGATGPPRRFFSSSPAPDSSPIPQRPYSLPPSIVQPLAAAPARNGRSIDLPRKSSEMIRLDLPLPPIQPLENDVPKNILVSIALQPLRSPKSSLPPTKEDSTAFELDPLSPTGSTTSQGAAGSKRSQRVGLLDVFLVEVFVLNRGNTVKRFTIGVPALKGEDEGGRVASIVALDQDVRIGPLAPQSCQSVRLRFLAVRPGAHTLEQLRIVDLATGCETRLENPLQIVVE